MWLDALGSFFNYLLKYMRVLRLSDFIDVFIIAVLVYYVLRAIRGTRAVQLLRGLMIAVVIYMLSNIFQLDTLYYILSAVFQIALFAVVVIFQPELRNLLTQLGKFKIGSFFGISLDGEFGKETKENVIKNISSAAANMSKTKTGALIVIERDTRLGEYMNSGTKLEAEVTTELLENIFVPKTPLHDGAVIIRGNKIITAGCLLPLTSNTNLSSELGTRHRAALGLSEASDAVIVIVSEETGTISMAIKGSLTRNLTETSLEKALMKLISTDSEKSAGRDTLKKIKFWNRSETDGA